MAKTSDKSTSEKAEKSSAKKATAKKTAAKKTASKKGGTNKGTAKKAATKKKAAVKKATPKKKAVRKKTAAKGGGTAVRRITAGERHQMIAEAAYLRGEAQGFCSDEREDWLLAEAEVDMLLAKANVALAD
jgi:hypothetical protein